MVKTKTAYSKEFFDDIQDGSTRSARIVLPLVFRLLRPRRVVDVGCGRGAWLRVASELGAEQIQGLDGSYVQPESLLIARDQFQPTDLRKPFQAPGRFDLAMCLEVAEHLPKSAARSLIEGLTEAAPVVLFSAAIPGQEGRRHINEQFPEYWYRLFRAHGYVALDVVRPRVAWDPEVEPWYAQNTLLYVAEEYYRASPELQVYTPLTADRLLPWVHAGIWRGRVRWKGPLGILKLMLKRMV